MRLLVAVLLIVASTQASYVPIQPGPDYDFIEGVEFTDLQVEIHIVGAVATTSLALTMENPTELPDSYTAWLPMLPGTAILSVNVTTSNGTLEGRVEERQDARNDYTASQAAGQTAVLMEQHAEAVRISSSIPANETQLLQISFVQTVDVRGASWNYWLPLSRANAPTTVTIHAPSEAQFPGQTFSRLNGVTTITGDDLPDLLITWPTVGEDWQVTALQGDEAFLLSIRFAGGEVWPRELAMILDKSGSMSGSKIVDARNSLSGLLPLLPGDDVFAIWAFDSSVIELTEGFLPVTEQTIEDARSVVKGIPAGGSTNIYEALETALQALPRDRLSTLLFVTDGLPSSGITDHDEITARVEELAGEVVIHTVAIGIDADQTFLQDISEVTGGTMTILRGNENLEERLAALYATIHSPVIRNLELALPPSSAVFPNPLPVYHDDSVLHLVGKGQLPESWTLTATGETPAGEFTTDIPVTAAEYAAAVDAIWATRQVDAWLTEERTEGNDIEDEIVQLATQFGIITPYTSWIVSDINLPADEEVSAMEDAGHAYASSSASSSPGSPTSAPLLDRAYDGQPDWAKRVEDESEETPFSSIFLLLGLMAILVVRRR